MTQAEWDKKHKDYKTTRAVDSTATHARHRVRHAMTTGHKYGRIFITDATRVDPPAPPFTPAGPEVFAREKDSRQGSDLSPSMEMSRAIHAVIPKDDRIPYYEQLHEMGKAAAAGVQVVIAPQLFPTPPELADRMVALADIRPGLQVSEPSAGTVRIIGAIRRKAHGYTITAVELNCDMAHRLRTVDCVDDTRQADFLECNGNLGTFDRIAMNPPLCEHRRYQAYYFHVSSKRSVSKDRFCKLLRRSMLAANEPSRRHPGDCDNGFRCAAICSSDEILNNLKAEKSSRSRDLGSYSRRPSVLPSRVLSFVKAYANQPITCALSHK